MQNDLRRKQMLFTTVLAVIIVVSSAAITLVAQTFSDQTLTSRSLDLISANATQAQMNVDQFFLKVEKVAALLYSDEAYYEFDATDTSIDEYDKLQAEDVIENRIIDLGMMENFCDFAVIYANDESFGWVSQTTKGLFPDDGMYDLFAGAIKDDPKQQAWIFGVKGNNDRIYYAKRLNEHAVVMVSFYVNELADTFAVPESLGAMTVRLVDTDNTIVYSTDPDEVSQQLPDDIDSLVGDDTYSAIYDEENLATVDALGNGWRIICSEPMSILMRDSNALRQRTTLAAVSLIIAAILIDVLMGRHFNNQVNSVVDDLSESVDSDRMTGLLNKTAFELRVTENLSKDADGRTAAFLMCDLDNFKAVNDTLGHNAGDEVIIRMASVLRESFADTGAVIGRIGGDEFAAYWSFEEPDEQPSYERLIYLANKLQNIFNKEFEAERSKSLLSLSSGGVVARAGAFDFETLYTRADNAMYESKNDGKGKSTVRMI